jgi:hypothetical protein
VASTNQKGGMSTHTCWASLLWWMRLRSSAVMSLFVPSLRVRLSPSNPAACGVTCEIGKENWVVIHAIHKFIQSVEISEKYFLIG